MSHPGLIERGLGSTWGVKLGVIHVLLVSPSSSHSPELSQDDTMSPSSVVHTGHRTTGCSPA
jgi:hypothetical protein